MQINAAPGVHRVEDAYTNRYLLEEDGRITIVDSGVPDSATATSGPVRTTSPRS
jgi:hypothetical protein